MEWNYDVSGHTALVTGSSRGIGSAVALELARGGADIVVHCASSIEKAQAVAEEIRAMGRNCTVVQADLTKPEEVQGLLGKLPKIDILVLNASLQIRKHWDEITLEEYTAQMNCNFLSSLLLCQQAAAYMKEQGWGRIVAIGSVQELKPHPDMLVYSSSKCAQTGMVRSLAGQLAPYGITVNSVAPGVVYTDRNKEALADEAYAKIISASIPAGFYAEKEDMAGIVRLLCSPFGRYITGQNIYADGGKSL